MGKLTIEDLKKIRESATVTGEIRPCDDKEIKVVVHMGTCGIASGAQPVYDEILDAVSKKKLDIPVGQSGCIGICDREPIITILKKGELPVRYGKVTPEVAIRIVESHLANGKPVMEYLLANVAVK